MVVGANTPQSIVEASLGELWQARSRQHLWKADGDVRESPEVAAPQVIFQIHRLAPHNAQAALHQLHGARQRQQTDEAQIAPLGLIQLPMLPTAGGDIRLALPLTHFFPSRTHCRRRPDSISSSDTTIIISSSVMLT